MSISEKHGRYKHGRATKENKLTYKKEWYQENKERILKNLKGKYRKDYYKKTYNITLEEAIEIQNSQENKCPICSKFVDICNDKNSHIDHCHKTGKVRNILCNTCNSGLGHFKDNIELLKSAILYLQKHQIEEEILELQN